MSTTPLSALLITKNEEIFIGRALSSLTWCEEIIVVDAESTDRTREICKDPDAPWAKKIKFVTHPWTGFSAQRNFAMTLAKNDWVFFLDGDECCSPELAQTIQRLWENGSPQNIQYKIRRQEFFLKKPIHHSIWNPSYPTRLFNKNGAQYIKEIHEGVQSPWPIGALHEPIVHVEDLRIERFMVKLNDYTTIQAKVEYQSGKRTNLFRMLFAFPAMFYKNYVYYQGYKDGYEGFVISMLEATSRTIKHLKLWQEHRIATRYSSVTKTNTF